MISPAIIGLMNSIEFCIQKAIPYAVVVSPEGTTNLIIGQYAAIYKEHINPCKT